MSITNGCNDQRPHFVLIPFMAQGHTIPVVDIARLIADRGSLVTFITTPVNAAQLRPVIDQVKAAKLPIRIVELKFPCAEAGLPEGCENLHLIPSDDLHKPFFTAISMLRQQLEIYLRKVEPTPSCIITDFMNSWTAEVARELNIPRVVFYASSCLFISSMINIREHKVYDGVDDLFQPVVLPNMRRKIEVTRAQSPGWFIGPDWDDIRDKAIEAEASADGYVINTFCELEAEFIGYLKMTTGKPVWPIGPLSLYSKDVTSKATRGKKSSVDEHQVLGWLDSKEPESVIYINFGSLVRMKPLQVIEIGCGLEASNTPFIWVIKEGEKCPEIDKWMSEGFEERTKDRGLVITGWAPQVVILSHPSVAGFMTHCGWNSVLEAVSAGLPMITWPHFVDHFLNETLVVEVLEIGVSLGVKVPYYFVKGGEVVVKREDVEKAIASLMDEGEEGGKRRKRAAEFAEKARRAMEEGGSSCENLNLLIEHFRENSK